MKRMSFILMLLAMLVLFTGCTVIKPSFKDSNQLFMEQTIDNVKLGNAVSNSIPKGSKVALVSIEKDITLDEPLLALIEDQLISSLSKAGYIVIDRDPEILERLNQESMSGNYTEKHSKPKLDAMLENSKFEVSGNYDAFVDAIQEGTSDYKYRKTNLTAADYVISYRVLECGVIYQKSDEPTKEDREGLVRLNIRVHKSNGEIVYADNLQGEKKDQIDTVLKMQLADFKYSFFQHKYPLQSAPRKTPLFNNLKTASVSSGKGFFYLAASFGSGESKKEDDGTALGATIGYGNSKIGRIGLNYMTPTEKSENITLQYERPIRLINKLYITPKVGFGYSSVEWKEAYDYHYGNYYYRDKKVDGLAGANGIALEYQFNSKFLVKLGYDGFAHSDSKDANNSAIALTLGLRL